MAKIRCFERVLRTCIFEQSRGKKGAEGSRLGLVRGYASSLRSTPQHTVRVIVVLVEGMNINSYPSSCLNDTR